MASAEARHSIGHTGHRDNVECDYIRRETVSMLPSIRCDGTPSHRKTTGVSAHDFAGVLSSLAQTGTPTGSPTSADFKAAARPTAASPTRLRTPSPVRGMSPLRRVSPPRDCLASSVPDGRTSPLRDGGQGANGNSPVCTVVSNAARNRASSPCSMARSPKGGTISPLRVERISRLDAQSPSDRQPFLLRCVTSPQAFTQISARRQVRITPASPGRSQSPQPVVGSPQSQVRSVSPVRVTPVRTEPSRPIAPQGQWLLPQTPAVSTVASREVTFLDARVGQSNATVDNVREVEVEIVEGSTKEELKRTNAALLAKNEALHLTITELTAKAKDLQHTNTELSAANDQLKNVNAELQGINKDLESRLQSNGQQFLKTIAGLEEKISTLLDCNRQLTDETRELTKKQVSSASEELKNFEVIQKDMQEQMQEAQSDANDLRRQLVKQKVDYCQRLAEAEQERDNIMSAMTEESEELQSRITRLMEENAKLVKFPALSSTTASPDCFIAGSSQESNAGSGMVPSDSSDSHATCDCGMPSQPQSCSELSQTTVPPSPLDSAVLADYSSRTMPLIGNPNCSSRTILTMPRGDEQLSMAQASISRRKQKLTDVENTLLKEQIEALRTSLSSSSRAGQLLDGCSDGATHVEQSSPVASRKSSSPGNEVCRDL